MINYNQSQGEISECESDVDDRELLENFAGIINMDENDIPEDSDDEENESDDDEPQIKRMKIDESTVFSSDVEWKKNPSKVTSHLDSFVGETGPTSFSKNNIKFLLDTFMIFFPDEMKEKIVSCTNARASEKRKKEWMVMTISIFEKLLGIVILLGALKSAREKIRYVVQGPFSRFDKYRQYMIPAKLIVSYLANLCFENNVEEGDKFGCIRNIYQKFIAICGMAYNIGSEITVDETLIASKNRFKMRQYLKSKPAKYGLKFWTLTDANSYYMAMQYPYLGKESLEEKKKEKLKTVVVKKLTNNYVGDHRTVYMDSFFSDLDLSQYLLQNKMYSVGTCNSNRRFIPTTFKKNSRKRDIGAVYVYHDQMTLVNFKEKKNRNAVNVISTKHIGLQKEEALPNIVKNYRKYMGGVDRFDQLCGNYTVQRCSQR